MGDDEPTIATSVSSTGPGDFQKPYLTTGYDRAQSQVLNRPLQFFPGQTYADQDPATLRALSGVEGLASGSQPIIQGAQNQLTGTLNGDYLMGGNPAYSAMINRAVAPLTQQFQNVVKPGIDAQFSGGGRYSSGIAKTAAQDMASDSYLRAVGDVSGNLAYQNYGQERQNQLGAMQAAPGIDAFGYAPYQQLAGVGAAREGFASQGIQDQMARHSFAQSEPTNRLAQYMAMIAGGNVGGQTVTQTPQQQSNPLLMGLGAGSMGIGALNGLFNPSSGLFPGAMGSMFSDRRLKKDIVKVGTWRGKNLYAFKYKTSDIRVLGVMADEVNKEAVTMRGGFAMVDYAKVA